MVESLSQRTEFEKIFKYKQKKIGFDFNYFGMAEILKSGRGINESAVKINYE